MQKIDYSAFTQNIRDRVSALDVGRDYGLNPGRDGRCRCIFCSGNRTDTLRLYPGNRGSYCFRCHTGADVIRIVMEVTGQNFPQAVRDLNDRYGLGLPLDKPDPERTRKAREAAEQRRQEEEEKKQREMRLLTALWDASDEVWELEQVIKCYAPQRPGEPFTDVYVEALRRIDAARDVRDHLFDEVYGKF